MVCHRDRDVLFLQAKDLPIPNYPGIWEKAPEAEEPKVAYGATQNLYGRGGTKHSGYPLYKLCIVCEGEALSLTVKTVGSTVLLLQ